MRPHARDLSMSLQLDPSLYALGEPREMLMLQAIASETESYRIELRQHPVWGLPVVRPPRGMRPLSNRQVQMSETIADQLPWPALLTWGDCASKVATRSSCTKREVLEFALSICPYAHIPTVLNFIAMDATGDGIGDAAKILSPIIRALKAKESRIKAGASVGGKKSARTRQSNSNIPAAAKLLQERSNLIESGRSASEVAGILAQRYGVHPSTIRLKLKGGENKAG